MKQIAIIGIGMGNATTTVEALGYIKKAEVLLGAKRLIDEFADLGKPSYIMYQAEAIANAIETIDVQYFAILVSGDVGFYSGAASLYERLSAYDVLLIPGISTVSYFFSKCRLPWQNAALLSCHGKDSDIVGVVRRNKLTFVLTGGNISKLADDLCTGGFGDLTVRVGENLGLQTEEIIQTTVAELYEKEYASLSVLLIENENYDSRVRSGIPDGEFIRSQLPMTKAEVRAACISKLLLRPTDICYDIGCGTGSVTVEMALSVYQGHVYAIDKNQEAMALTRKNCTSFHINNVTLSHGFAPEALSRLPTPNSVFIGGSSGNIRGIVGNLHSKNPLVRIVMTAVTIESLSEAIDTFDQAGIASEIVQLSVSRVKEVGGVHMMSAQNPVFIISGGGHE